MRRTLSSLALLLTSAACYNEVIQPPENEAPTPQNDALSATEDQARAILSAELLLNDDDPNGDTLSIVAVTNAQNGTVALGQEQIIFTPDPNATGTASFQYTVSDGQAEATAQVSLNISAVNDAPIATDDTRATNEDTALALPIQDLLANDDDPDGDTLSLVAVSGAQNGTASILGAQVVFQPALGFVGAASFQYTISDGSIEDTATVTVNVGAFNQAPNAADDAFSVAEDTALSLSSAQLLANDDDPDGDALSVIQADAAVNGTVALVNGIVTFTPTADFFGTASFQYTVSDGNGETDTATVTLSVTPVNDAPVAVADVFDTDEDSPLVLLGDELLANDSDLENNALSIIAAGDPVNGSITLANGQLTFTPAPNFFGDASFTYILFDGNRTALGVASIVVNPVNDAPVAVDDNRTTSEDISLVVTAASVLANDADIDSGALEVVAVGGAVNGSVSLAGGNITFTPNANFNGAASFQYTVSDGTLTDTGAVAVTVNAVNDAPTAVDDSVTTGEDQALTLAAIALTGNDLDLDGDVLLISAVSGAVNGSVILNGNGSVTFTPDQDFTGPASFQYTVSDGNGGTDTGLVSVEVGVENDAPVAVDDAGFVTNEDTLLSIPGANLTANDTDADNDVLFVIAVARISGGNVSVAANTITFTPDANFNGAASFQYTVSDGNGGTDTGLVSVTVNAVNDAPVAVDDSLSTNEDTPLLVSGASLAANDTDVDAGAILTVVAVSDAVNGSVSLASGNITFTPNANFNGAASFQYTVSDGALTDVGLVSVTINAVNDPPVAVDDNASTNEDTPVVIPGAALVANDLDIDGGALSVLSVANGAGGVVVLSGGNITFTPNTNFNGDATFTYTVSDGNGGTDIGLVTVAVAPVNDAPVAVDDSANTNEDTPLVLAASVLLANDTDVDSGAILSVTAVSGAVNGSVSLAGNSITFTPNANFNGAASFQYTVSDGTLTDIGVVAVTVAPVNDAPVAVDDSASTNEDVPLVLSSAALVANDTDIDSGTLTVVAVSGAVNGTVSLAGNAITFTPNTNFNGAASFQYTVSDGSLTDVGLVSVTVNAVNDAPVAVDDSASTDEETPLILAAAVLLANDTDVDAGAILTVVAVSGAVNGTVSLAGGNITFTPNANFNGAASFQYTVSDGALTDTGAVSVTVNAVNDAPTADDKSASVSENSAANLITLTGIDVEGSALSFAIVSAPTNGTLGAVTPTSATSATVAYTPNVNVDGADSFTYRASDGALSSAIATVTITITNVPRCGDGTTDTGEGCDDGNSSELDGCTTQCVVARVCDSAEFPGADRFAVEAASGSCYASFDGEQTTFAAGQAACVSGGGYLVTITSAAENSVVLGVHNTAENPWIGAQDDANDTDAIFAWVTGEVFSFANFSTGQPDDDAAFGGNGEALHLVNAAGQWNDTNPGFAGFVTGRICEYEADSCGDGVLQSGAPFSEACDDGNLTPGDGCDQNCQIEP